jgi:type II secretory pathway predicted ATPase ExeA
MYEEFFGLDRRPFSLAPSSDGVYWTDDHRRGYDVLRGGIEQLTPLSVLSGDVGTGKTTLIRYLLDSGPSNVTYGLLSNFGGNLGELFQWILMAFGQDFDDEAAEPTLLIQFKTFLIDEYAAGRRCVLIVDEAQNVATHDLERLRLLTNINADGDTLLMLILVGQPQLQAKLQLPELRQVAARIANHHHLGPLSRLEAIRYVGHRMIEAGGSEDVFQVDALLEVSHHRRRASADERPLRPLPLHRLRDRDPASLRGDCSGGDRERPRGRRLPSTHRRGQQPL